MLIAAELTLLSCLTLGACTIPEPQASPRALLSPQTPEQAMWTMYLLDSLSHYREPRVLPMWQPQWIEPMRQTTRCFAIGRELVCRTE